MKNRSAATSNCDDPDNLSRPSKREMAYQKQQLLHLKFKAYIKNANFESGNYACFEQDK